MHQSSCKSTLSHDGDGITNKGILSAVLPINISTVHYYKFREFLCNATSFVTVTHLFEQQVLP